jgi:thiamine-phosphate pyrophosphorylase
MVGHLHYITDTRFGRNPLDPVPAALDAGVDVIQVRAKELTDDDAYRLAVRVVELCAPYRAACIVDDRLDVALASGAAGVHLGEGDLPVAAARAVAGPRFVIGATARDPAAALAAVTAGASYLGVGPCFSTSTKRGLPAPIGVAGVAAVHRVADIPLIAVGGVRADRVTQLIAAGAHGIAVVDAISGASDPAGAARELLAALGAAT